MREIKHAFEIKKNLKKRTYVLAEILIARQLMLKVAPIFFLAENLKIRMTSSGRSLSLRRPASSPTPAWRMRMTTKTLVTGSNPVT
jgi:hypothetical protein